MPLSVARRLKCNPLVIARCCSRRRFLRVIRANELTLTGPSAAFDDIKKLLTKDNFASETPKQDIGH
jgi:hypothetical protein